MSSGAHEDARPVRADVTRTGLLGLRSVFVGLLLVGAAWTLARTLTVENWPNRTNPSENLDTVPRSAVTGPVVRRLESDGVVVRAPVRRMLDVVLRFWSDRADLRSKFSLEDGTPDVANLLVWAQSLQDSSGTWIAPHLGALAELRARMGYIGPDGKVLPVIYWGLRNRRHPSQDLTLLVGRLADHWDQRKDVRDRFSSNGHVDLIAYLEYVNRIPATDSAYEQFIDDTIPIHEALAELRRNRRG